MVRYHGNWCGPNWTAGQYKPTEELTEEDRDVPAIDALDEACRNHDVGLYDADSRQEVQNVNRRFYREAGRTGIKGAVAAALVAVGGPSMPRERVISELDSEGIDMTRSSKKLRGKGPIPGYDAGTRGRKMTRQQTETLERQVATRKVPRGQQAERMDVDDDAADNDEFGDMEDDQEAFNREMDRAVGPLPNLPGTRQPPMDGEPSPEPAAARAAQPGMPGSVSKETQISPYPSLTYGLQETHTTILPYRAYCSVVTGGSSTAGYAGVKLELRMNGIWDCIITNVETTLGAGSTPGIFGVPLIQAAPSNSGRTSNKAFPIVHTTDPVTAEGPAWRNYWAQLYEYYTVLG